MTVAWIFRKPQPQYFSIEKVFSLVEGPLQEKVSISKVFMLRHKLSPVTIFRNIRMVRSIKADLYHVTGDIHYVVFGLPAKKTILTIHDCVFMYKTKGIKRKLLYHLFLKWPVKRSKLITTISESSKQDIIRFTNCAPHKVIVIPNPLDERLAFQPNNFNKDCPELLFIGTSPNKNLFRVIEALQGVPCKLHVVGKIPPAEREQLMQHKISFQESFGLSDQELRQAYSNADLVLFPSLYEGFGLPIIEGQQTGRPVITSNISPMKDIAGEGACLVDPFSVASIREGFFKVIQDDHYRNTIIAKGVTNAQQYKPRYIANAYLNVYSRFTPVNA